MQPPPRWPQALSSQHDPRPLATGHADAPITALPILMLTEQTLWGHLFWPLHRSHVRGSDRMQLPPAHRILVQASRMAFGMLLGTLLPTTEPTCMQQKTRNEENPTSRQPRQSIRFHEELIGVPSKYGLGQLLSSCINNPIQN